MAPAARRTTKAHPSRAADGAEQGLDAGQRHRRRRPRQIRSARLLHDQHEVRPPSASACTSKASTGAGRALSSSGSVVAARHTVAAAGWTAIHTSGARDPQKAAQTGRRPALQGTRSELDLQPLELAAAVPEARHPSRHVDREADAGERRRELGHREAPQSRRPRQLEANPLAPDGQAQGDAGVRRGRRAGPDALPGRRAAGGRRGGNEGSGAAWRRPGKRAAGIVPTRRRGKATLARAAPRGSPSGGELDRRSRACDKSWPRWGGALRRGPARGRKMRVSEPGR